jgi:hypothetical protein
MKHSGLTVWQHMLISLVIARAANRGSQTLGLNMNTSFHKSISCPEIHTRSNILRFRPLNHVGRFLFVFGQMKKIANICHNFCFNRRISFFLFSEHGVLILTFVRHRYIPSALPTLRLLKNNN